MGPARRLLAGAEPRHDRLRVDGRTDLLGRPGGPARAQRHHRAPIHLHGKHAPCVRQRGDGESDLLFPFHPRFAAVADAAAGTASAAVLCRQRYDHVHFGGYAAVVVDSGPWRWRTAGDVNHAGRVQAELEHALRAAVVHQRLARRRSRPERLDEILPA